MPSVFNRISVQSLDHSPRSQAAAILLLETLFSRLSERQMTARFKLCLMVCLLNWKPISALNGAFARTIDVKPDEEAPMFIWTLIMVSMSPSFYFDVIRFKVCDSWKDAIHVTLIWIYLLGAIAFFGVVVWMLMR